MVWDCQRDNDPSHVWLRERIIRELSGRRRQQ
jgi:hypothetical protein